MLLDIAIVAALAPWPSVIAYRKGRSVPTMMALTVLCYPLALLQAAVMDGDVAVLEARRRAGHAGQGS